VIEELTLEEREERLARRKKKRIILILLSCLFIVAGTVGGAIVSGFEALSLPSNLFFFFMLNINVLALFWLIYFVARNIIRLLLERRRGVIGTRFKAKVVGTFLVLIAIPVVLLFVVATQLGTNYIDRFFTPEFKKPIEKTIEIARAVYDNERVRVLGVAQLALKGLELPPGYRTFYYETVPENATSSVRSAFKGEPGDEVISDGGIDTIRAALPLVVEGQQKGVVVVDTTLSVSVTRDIEQITDAYEAYLHLEAFTTPLKLNSLMILAFFTLMIVFTSLWVALRVATWMTEPVRDLAQATEEVAAGNLSVEVHSKSQDEIGMLIQSFNKMVKEIRDGRDSLEQAYSNLNNTLRNIHSSVVSLDPRGRIILINDAACEVFGVVAREIIGKPYMSLLEKIESETFHEMVHGLNLDAFKKVEQELWAHVGKQMLHLRVSITSLKGPRGGNLGFLIVIDDITELIKAQRANAWQEVARRMAHEIKNPLTPIQLNAERMLKKWLRKDKDFDQIFESSSRAIIDEVQGLKKLVDEFSKLGRMPEIKRRAHNFRNIISSLSNLYGNMKGIELRFIIPKDMPEVYIDAEQIKRVFINLFDNAIEAMRKEGIITVSVDIDKELSILNISVSDTGPGIDDADKEKLFAPYFSKKKNGSGLGLAIAERIVAEHGGSITVSDKTPNGSIFSISLPLLPQ
jgi:two-component system nitrogen regulation sensor histidine kinase NtrY